MGVLVDVGICHKVLHNKYRFLILRHHDLVGRSLNDIICTDGSILHQLRIAHDPACLEIEDKP